MKKFLQSVLLAIAITSFIPAFSVQAATTKPTSEAVAPTIENSGEQSAVTEPSESKEEPKEKVGIVGMFGLNWKLFLAQLINFAIILFVLWKWVFGPVTSGLTKRTQKIEDSLAEAERIMKDRSDFDSWKKSEIAQARVEASGIITKAKQEAEAVKNDSMAQTKADQTALVEQTRRQLEQEKQLIITEAKVEIADLVVTATETILKEKINSAKDKELIKEALKQAQA